MRMSEGVTRVVLDTNVLISALLKPGSVPDRLIRAIARPRAIALYDVRIATEYREVLSRPKFKAIPPERVAELLARVLGSGEDLGTVPAWDGAMTDDSDRIFVEVALAGRAEVLVTGNLRDYPSGLGFEVQPPATLLAALE